jgi:hypothetical protein
MLDKLLRMLRKSWWAPVIAQVFLTWLAFGWMWSAIEPVMAQSRLKLAAVDGSALWLHVVFAMLVGLQSTVVLVVLVRVTDRGAALLTRSELLNVNQLLQPVLASVGALSAHGVSPQQIQTIVQGIATVVAQIHFDRGDLPIMTDGRDIVVPAGMSFNCGLCGEHSVPITRTGQCQRCRLFCPGWTGTYQASATVASRDHSTGP